jgi:hypothetical protein
MTITTLIFINLSFFILLALIAYSGYKLYKQYDEMDSEQRIWSDTFITGVVILFIISYAMTFYIFEASLSAERISRFRLLLQIIPIIMGGCALIIAFLNFKRKAFNFNKEGLDNLSYFSGLNHHNSNHSFTIMNLKDKPIVIFNIVIKLHNISISLPYKYPLTINGYHAERLNMPYINKFISHANNGYFDVMTNEKYHYTKPSSCSGNQIVKALAYEDFTVYAETNVRQKYIKVTKQNFDSIPNSQIHIEEIDIIHDIEHQDKLWRDEYYDLLDNLPLSRQGNNFKL